MDETTITKMDETTTTKTTTKRTGEMTRKKSEQSRGGQEWRQFDTRVVI